MARGPRVDREALRIKLIEVTRQLIQAEGFAAVNARRLAADIGCSVGTIYNVVDNLDAIVLAINAATLEDMRRTLAATVSAGADPLEAALQIGRAFVAYSENNARTWQLLTDFNLTPGSTLPPSFQEKIEALFLLVSDHIQPLLESREEADRAAKVLWAGLHGICSLSLQGKLTLVRAESAETLAESLIRNYLGGLRKGRAPDRSDRGQVVDRR